MRKLLFAGLMMCIAAPTLWAQGGSRETCTTVGTMCSCNHNGVVLRMNGTDHMADFAGSMNLSCVDTGTTQNGLWWWKHISSGFSVTGTEATLGTINVVLDGTRTAPDSYMTSLTVGSTFPASHHVYAYAKATLSAFPGITYRSTTPFHMYNNSINSFGVAGAHTSYTVDSDVDFEDISNPGVVAFTVKASPTIVNP